MHRLALRLRSTPSFRRTTYSHRRRLEFPSVMVHQEDYPVRFLSTDTSFAVEPSWREQVLLFLDQNCPRQAQHVMEEQAAILPNNNEERIDVMGQILDAWIHYQKTLLEDSITLDRSQLKAICEAAEQAHLLLEQMMPFLASSNNTSSVTAVASSDDDDDDLSQPSIRRNYYRDFDAPATARCNAVLEAWARAVRAGHTTKSRITRAIPQRAQYLLERMELAYENQTDMVVVRPSVESYNRVLEAWAYSHEHMRGTMAERIFQKLSNNVSGSRPNGESYKLIIWAWALSGERRAAFTATGHLMKMLRKLYKGDEDMEPALEDYRITLKAWTTAEDKASPGKAMSVLRLMDYAYEKGTTQVQADFDCFRYLLITAARRPLLPDLGPLVDDVLKRMATRFLVPDTECYGAAIETWKNAALNPDLFAFRDRSVKRTLELLAEMRVAQHQSTTSVSIEPTTRIINHVIETLSVSSNPRRMEQAEQLLLEMEEMIGNDATCSAPNAESYARVINVWKTCKSTDKVPRAKAILWRMEEKYNDLLPTQSGKRDDFVGVFNAFVRVCGSTEVKSEERGSEIFREALLAVESIRTLDGLEPNAETYAALLEACENLLPLGIERQHVIEKVFRLCCNDGMVDENVLIQLRSAATQEQYSKLVIAVSEDVDGTKMVPEAWTFNALGGRVVTADGRRTKPLSVDGKLAVTAAMQEFRMRRMRDKRNRNLLRGGRLPRPKAVPNF